MPAGTHTLTITLSDAFSFVFDYIEAAVPGDIPAAMVTYPNVSPALDFDTDATYKVSPQRLLWHLTKLGFQGQINEYLGVFWWNQRKRVGATWNSATVSFGGTWVNGDVAVVNIGKDDDQNPPVAGFQMSKSVIAGDTVDTIAEHFAQYINAASVAMWAEKSGPGQLTIWTRTPNWGDTLTVRAPLQRERLRWWTGNLNVGVDGTWQVDPAAANPINFPIRQWHVDFFAAAKALGLAVTTSFSMELVNPPTEDGTAATAWQARYANGTPVTTDTRLCEFTLVPVCADSESDELSEIGLHDDGGIAERCGTDTLAAVRRISLVVLFVNVAAGRILCLHRPHQHRTGATARFQNW